MSILAPSLHVVPHKLGYFGCSLMLVYLVPLMKVSTLNTQK